MAKLGWFSSDWAERSAINDAHETLEYMAEADMGMAEQIGKLFKLDRKQGQQIVELKAMLLAVTNLLVESGVVPEENVVAAIKGALDEVTPKPAKKGEAKRVRMTRCASCGKDVPANSTNYTETGEVCDACFSGY